MLLENQDVGFSRFNKPIRISTDPDDPGFLWWVHCELTGQRAHAYLDGVYQESALTADEAAGLILRPVRDENGGIVLMGDGEILTEAVTGAVEIRLIKKT